jgi:hypothetical protein
MTDALVLSVPNVVAGVESGLQKIAGPVTLDFELLTLAIIFCPP